MSGQVDWSGTSAPALDEFERIAEAAYRALPEEFRSLCDGILIRVSEFPDDDVLREMKLESPFDILGLFTGIGLSQDTATVESGRMPNMIHLYRRPILDYWVEHEETLGTVIAHVLIHEIGHHFGLSDEDMEQIEAAADEAR